MTSLPSDYLVDILRVDLTALDASRVILLGNEEEMSGDRLRVGLARWGIQVLVPPKAERMWIAGMAEESISTAAACVDSVARLRTLLADGQEHGVKAIVCTSEALAAWVHACKLDIPLVALDSRGSVVPLRNIVFDMGGVLFRWDPLAMASRVAKSDDDAKLLADAVYGSLEWAWQDAGAVDEETVIWSSKLRLPAHLRPAVEELVLHWHDHRVPIEGTDELISDLKAAGYSIYLLSNAGKSFERYEAQLPARACFDGMVVSYRERVVKPDARIYQALIDRYGLSAGECLFIDDTSRNVFGARRLGMRGWHFTENVAALRAALLDPAS